MRHGRQGLLLILSVLFFASLVPTAVLGQPSAIFDIPSLLRERDPETMIGSLKEDMQEKVREEWVKVVMADSKEAAERNGGQLYANPSLQAYVNRLGQRLIPREASEKVPITFKIVENPMPYADTLATGTVYLSTGMISLLDNESQLAFLLMHEAGHVMLSHHVKQIVDEEKAERKAGTIKFIGSVAGAIAGGVLGANKGGGPLGAAGATAGGIVASKGGGIGLAIAEGIRTRRFLREIQFESDQFATQVLLQHGFDVREAPTLMAKVADIVRRSGAAVEMAFGSAGDLPQRSVKVKELISGVYQPTIVRILNGSGFRMSSPRYSQLISELKRDNGMLALDRDLFIIARTNLEEAAAVRTDDPLTMYGLGLLYRAVGRSDEDVSRAAGYLKAAMAFDDVRHRFPEVYLQYAVELLSREDPRRYPEVQKSLKTYVTLYQRNEGGALPREMRFVYDYLDLTGDRSWVAYRVNNVSSEAPYQLTGDEKIDGKASPVEKHPTGNH